MKTFSEWLSEMKFNFRVNLHPEDDPEHVFHKPKLSAHDDPENVLNGDEPSQSTIITKTKPINFSKQSTIIKKRL